MLNYLQTVETLIRRRIRSAPFTNTFLGVSRLNWVNKSISEVFPFRVEPLSRKYLMYRKAKKFTNVFCLVKMSEN